MHQSIPAAPSPPGLLRGICPPCQSRGWGICKFCTARGPGAAGRSWNWLGRSLESFYKLDPLLASSFITECEMFFLVFRPRAQPLFFSLLFLSFSSLFLFFHRYRDFGAPCTRDKTHITPKILPPLNKSQ